MTSFSDGWTRVSNRFCLRRWSDYKNLLGPRRRWRCAPNDSSSNSTSAAISPAIWAEHNHDAYLQLAQAAADGRQLPTTHIGSTNVEGSSFGEQARQLHERTPHIREQYSGLFKALETLGKAIHYEDTDTIDAFYR